MLKKFTGFQKIVVVWLSLLTIIVLFYSGGTDKEELVDSVVTKLGNKVVKIETIKEVIPYKLNNKAYKGTLVHYKKFIDNNRNVRYNFSIETNSTDLPELIKCLNQRFEHNPNKGDSISIYFDVNGRCKLLGQ